MLQRNHLRIFIYLYDIKIKAEERNNQSLKNSKSQFWSYLVDVSVNTSSGSQTVEPPLGFITTSITAPFLK